MNIHEYAAQINPKEALGFIDWWADHMEEVTAALPQMEDGEAMRFAEAIFDAGKKSGYRDAQVMAGREEWTD